MRGGGGDCKGKDFGAAAYWDARYSFSSSSPSTGGKGGGGFFDWYQSYPALRPLLRARLPTSSRVLMLGCGNSFLSEEMVKDGYEEMVNIDISSVVIEQMREKHMDIPQLAYMQMDVRDMSFFGDGSFDCVLDKGDDAPHGASKMLAEVARLIRPAGIYILITYGAPKERVVLLNQAGCHWKVELYVMPMATEGAYLGRASRPLLGPCHVIKQWYFATPGYQLKWSNGAPQATMEKVAVTVDGQLPPDYVLKDPESHFIYVCRKSDAANGDNSIVAGQGETVAAK